MSYLVLVVVRVQVHAIHHVVHPVLQDVMVVHPRLDAHHVALPV